VCSVQTATARRTSRGGGTLPFVNKFQVPSGQVPPVGGQGLVAPGNVHPCHLHAKHMKSCISCRNYKEWKTGTTKSVGGEITETSGGAVNVSWTNLMMVDLAKYGCHNITPMLGDQILESPYFLSLTELELPEQIIEEIKTSVDHCEPYLTGSTDLPSSAFCCLYRLFEIKLSARGIKIMMDYTKSVFVRACGFLYCRIGLDAKYMWSFLKDYVLDDEVIYPSGEKGRETTVGQFVEEVCVSFFVLFFSY